MKTVDMIGKTFGFLKVLRFHHKSETGIPYVECLCTNKGCGKIKVVNAMSVRAGSVRSCGCLRSQASYDRCFEDLTGKMFGNLTVLREGSHDKRGRVRWVCQCNCADKTIVTVPAHCLKSGNTTSCGCGHVRAARKMGLSNRKYAPGAELDLSSVYKNMIARCYNPYDPHYDNYGGRGISVCKSWRKNIWNFINWGKLGYKPGLEIDRRDVDKNYNPENCRWITHAEQQRNKRNNRHVVVGGVDKLLYDWMLMFKLFANWCAKMYRRPKKYLENNRQYSFTTEQASDVLEKIVLDYGSNLLEMPDGSIGDIVKTVEESPRAIRFVCIRGENHTVAQWFAKLGIHRSELKRVCSLQDFEIRQFLIDWMNTHQTATS